MKKVDLNKEDRQYVEEVIDELADIFQTDVDALVRLDGKSNHSALASLLRPFIKTNYVGETANEATFRDNRTRDWSVKVYIWDVGNGQQTGELVQEYEAQVCTGLNAVGKWLRTAMEEHHGTEPDHVEQFTESIMSQRIGGLHAAISKGNGRATTRIKYTLRGVKYQMQATILRHD